MLPRYFFALALRPAERRAVVARLELAHRAVVGRLPRAACYLRFDTCDYSLDPGLVGRRVEVRVSDHEVISVALDTGELACRHPRSFARHRTITALEHARALRRRNRSTEPAVEVRPLAIYDQLIA